MAVRAVRGAIQVDANERDEILKGTSELVTEVLNRNCIDPEQVSITLDGDPVDAEIRSAEATAAVSAVSAIAAVRALLVDAQRELIADGAIVVEGRDIGSGVWAPAPPQGYLTPRPEARAPP